MQMLHCRSHTTVSYHPMLAIAEAEGHVLTFVWDIDTVRLIIDLDYRY